LRLWALQTETAGGRRRTSAAAILCLSCSFILALAQVTSGLAASPPAPLRAAGTQEVSSGLDKKPDQGSDGGSKTGPAAAPSPSGDESLKTAPAATANVASWSSVRIRGLEAPVVLKPEPKPEVEAADALDGPPKVKQASHKQDASGKKKKAPISAREQRVGPLPDGSFVFTQAFGCVPQLGNLYFAGDGCPPDRPVVHTGIDLAAPEGTVFYAAASGWVTLAGYDRPTPDANTRIIIQHDGRQEGYSTEYLHWVASYVAVGDYVRAGEPIGEVGNVGFSTGPHLHFSVIDLSTGEHIDPVRWLPPDNTSGAYKGRLPGAEMRLPAGTTAGQPEEADQNPAPIPTKVKVPKSPPQDETGSAGAKRQHRHDDATTEGQAKSASSSHGAKKRAKNGDTKASDASNSDQTRKRERHTDGKHSERSVSGEDGQRKHKDKSEDSGDQTTDTGRGGHQNEGASDPGKGSRHDRGGNDRGGGNNGDQRDNKHHGGSDDGKNNGSNNHDGNGQGKNDKARQKDEVPVDTAAEQSIESSGSDSQATTDETSKGAKDEAAPETSDDTSPIQEPDQDATSGTESSKQNVKSKSL
jgi:murein DD-endopeptidase MepM/ murein hydrolase activator NlpD